MNKNAAVGKAHRTRFDPVLACAMFSRSHYFNLSGVLGTAGSGRLAIAV